MPRDIKLDCYSFQLKKQLQAEDFKFEDFFSSFNTNNVQLTLQNQYNSFYADLLNYFGQEFRINDSETKGITIRSGDEFLVESASNVISGTLSGGDTGIGKNIQERENSTEGNQIDHFKIHSIPHFFQIWMPLDLNFCIVVVQSYTGESLSSMFLNHLQEHFNFKDLVTYNRVKFLPRNLVDDFRNNALIRSVTLKSSAISRPKRQALNPVLVEKEKLNVELVFKGFGRDSTWGELREWLLGENQGFLGVDLSNLNLEQPLDRVVEYSYQGRTTSGKLTNDYQIIPSVVITEHIELSQEFHPIFNSIKTYVTNFMNELIVESGYTRQ